MRNLLFLVAAGLLFGCSGRCSNGCQDPDETYCYEMCKKALKGIASVTVTVPNGNNSFNSDDSCVGLIKADTCECLIRLKMLDIPAEKEQ